MAEFYNGYIINPESYWLPSYRISPFRTSYIKRNYEIIREGNLDAALIASFFGEQYIYCNSGKQAIDIALQQYSLDANDEVWILTTSGNLYISNCVTRVIEKYCKWSRVRSGRTKLIFVNHEFGYCYKNVLDLKSYGLPIIEDRALSFASMDEKGETGQAGDFVIYSLPKFFPVNIGGVLQCNNPHIFSAIVKNASGDDANISILLSYYLTQVEAIKIKRKENLKLITAMFSDLNFHPRFTPTENEIPGVFMFTSSGLNLVQLKAFMQGNGIESSVFYGEEAFFLPLHQGLTEADCHFFYQLVNYFIHNGNK